MLRSVALGILGMVTASAAAGSDPVKAELLLGRTGYLPGRAMQAGIRLVVQPGWHVCWVNPGAGGAKMRAVWEVPMGWRAGELGYPAPERFQAGGLPGFGHGGEVILPVELQVPGNASGEARIKVRLSWSVCNGDGCVPGSTELSVALPQGGKSSRDAMVILRAAKKVPRGLAGARLLVRPAASQWQLTLRLPKGREVDLSGIDVFPVTTGMIDPAAVVSFVREREVWVAMAPRSTRGGASRHLKLVLAGGSLPFPVTIEGRVEG